MSFTPVIPSAGYAGWAFLGRTLDAQKKAFLADPALKREASYFRDHSHQIGTAQALVADRRLLAVALAAFGLEDDISNRAFLERVLGDGTLRPDALANRLADKRYLDFSRAFGFGDFPVPNTRKSDFADKILAAFEARRFEAAIGQQNANLRLALNAQRELPQIAGRNLSAEGKWFAIMGSPPLRSLVQTAFGLPVSVTGVDIDRQLGIFRQRAEGLLGRSDPAQFSDPAQVERLIRHFLVRADAASGPAAVSPALAILRGSGQPGTILSRYV